MTKKLKALIVVFCTIGLVALFGCSAVMDLATPCHIEPDLIKYVDEKPTSYLPFTTLWDAERLGSKFDYLHQVKQIDYQRLAEDDNIFVDYITSVQGRHIVSAKQFQKTVYTPNGPVGLALTTLFGGTLGAVLIPRPGDKKKT